MTLRFASRDSGLLLTGQPFVAWLPGESIFSLASRLHRLWGRPHAAETAQILFGGRRLGTHHDFPSGLEHFVGRTAGELGSVREIAVQRTLLKFFLPFLAADVAGDAVAAMSGKSVAHLKLRLGLLTSRYRAHHPLKACPACMALDLGEYQTTYWHIEHQYPGVSHCPLDGERLLQSTLKATGVGRFDWLLPDVADLRPIISEMRGGVEERVRSLGALIHDLADSSPAESLPFELFQRVFRSKADANGWVTSGGSIRTERVAKSYLSYCTSLWKSPELGELPADLAIATVHVSRLFRPIRSGTHPIRLLLAAHWLFGSADAFSSAVENASRESESQGVESSPAVGDAERTRREAVASRLRSGMTRRAIAVELELDFSTVDAVAAAEGFELGRRPKRLRGDLLKAIHADLLRGLAVSEVSEARGVSITTLNRYLKTYPDLATRRKKLAEDSVRDARRAQWLSLIAEHGALGIKVLRGMNAALYAWLYRNDRPWLAGNSPRAEIRTPAASSVDWQRRDELLAAEVTNAALELVGSGTTKVALWQLCQCVPELKAKVGALGRLPRTHAAIEAALGRRRRIKPTLI